MDYNVIPVASSFSWKGETKSADGQFHLVRESDGVNVEPHTVSKDYSVITPLDMIEELIPFVDQGWAMPEAAFQLRGGQTEIISLLLDPGELPAEIAGNEDIRWYIVAKNKHGRGAAECSVYGERIICGNGMTALARLSTFRVAHRGQAADKYKRAARHFQGIKDVISEMSNRMGLYMDIPLSHVQAEMMADSVVGFQDARKIDFKPAKVDRTKEGDMSPQQRNLHAAIMDAFNMPRFGTEGKTALDFYNGVTWVGTHWTPERSKLDDRAITQGLLDGTRGKREMLTLDTLDAYAESLS